jgi:hypothetical protein
MSEHDNEPRQEKREDSGSQFPYERRRSYDAGLSRIEQQLADMKELILTRENACQAAVMLRLTTHETEIGALKKFVNKIEAPVKFIGWCVVIVAGGILAVFGSKWGKVLWSKFFE